MVKAAAFIICLMLMMVVPIARNHKIFGIDLSEKGGEAVAVSVSSSGETVINTTSLTKDVIGYAGTTPVELYIRDGRISRIELLANSETPEFFGAVTNSDITDRYIGLTLQEAKALHPDAVSGATYSSKAVIRNIETAVNYALDEKNMAPAAGEIASRRIDNSWKFYVTLFVIACGGVIPFFLRKKGYRIVQLILNVVILGFWGGYFLCYSQMVSYLGNGIPGVVSALPWLLMLVMAFIYPMFGKTNHYCNWICPYGSLQELAGKVIKWRIPMKMQTVKALTVGRDALWFCLMWLLWTGFWFEWMDYEPFAAFFIRDASPVVLGIAGGFLLLSFVIARPYCRFLCPTGTLFKLAEGERLKKEVPKT